MNMGHDWIEYFESSGLEAVHWSSVGHPTAKDGEIMQWAEANQSVIVTQDLDFGHLHAIAGSRLPSIVQIRHDDLRAATIGEVVVLAIRNTIDLIDSGAILTVEPPLARIRPLPIVSTGLE
jgi:predicted nuclease of predicted toxin-antitoxin system